MENADVNTNVSDTQLKQDVEEFQKHKQVSKTEAESKESKDGSSFYQVIVDNSLFHPLGWTPPDEELEYTLVGTAIASLESKSEAFVVERQTNQFYTLRIGDELGDAVVLEIKDKMITLYENSEIVTYFSNDLEFLKTTEGSSGGDSSSKNDRDYDSQRNDQRSRTKYADIEAQKKRYARIMKESNQQIKNVIKEVAKIEKNMKKEEQKMLIEKKKTIATDLKLKSSSRK